MRHTIFLGWLTILLVLSSCQPVHEESAFQKVVSKTGFRSWDVVDASRNKTLHCQVWYPVAADAPAKPVLDSLFRRLPAAVDAPIAASTHTYPLIVLSHSFGTVPDSLAWLAQSLVANGYIVAAVRHDDFLFDGTPSLALWNRPLDVSALLTSILQSTLGAVIDPKRIGMAGFSAGGLTGVWLADGVAENLKAEELMPTKEEANLTSYAWIKDQLKGVDIEQWRHSYHDDRIKAYFLMAPSWAWIFHEKDFKGIAANVFIVAGEDDEEVDTARNAIRYAQWIPAASFHELKNHIGHWEFLGTFAPEGVEAGKEHLPKGARPTLPLEHRRRQAHQLVEIMAAKFFNQHLDKGD